MKKIKKPCTYEVVKEAMRIVAPQVRLPKCIRDGLVKPNKIMNKKDFVPYELSLELKELGFDEECFGFYRSSEDIIPKTELITRISSIKELNNRGIRVEILAPTFSQAFRFFRKKYGLCQIVIQNTDKDWTYDIMTIKGRTSYYQILDVLAEYEQAELACLQKLIKIVKDEKH